MRRFVNYFIRLSILMLINILLQGIVSLGYLWDVNNYNFIGVLSQIFILIFIINLACYDRKGNYKMSKDEYK